MTRHSFLALCISIVATSLLAQDGGNQAFFEALGRKDCPIVPLWPQSIGPGETKPGLSEGFQQTPEGTLVFRPVVKPEMIVIPPPPPTRSTGVAVLFCPGGGYGALETASIQQGSRWLNDQGITAFLLKYRVPKRDAVSAALQDVQRALSLVRSRAGEFGVDPDWIGIIGFSAGGHLAAACCHGYQDRSYGPVDAHDRASCRPNFALLIYPAYLAGQNGKLPETFAPPQRNRMPPVFVAFAANDPLIAGAFPYVLALREARVPVAFHVYEAGGHGKGLRPEGYPFSRWTFAAERWLADLLAAAGATPANYTARGWR